MLNEIRDLPGVRVTYIECAKLFSRLCARARGCLMLEKHGDSK